MIVNRIGVRVLLVVPVPKTAGHAFPRILSFRMTVGSTSASSSTTRSSYITVQEREAPAIVGKHPRLLAALRSIESLAPYEHATVLIEGESGTGKSYAARLLHQKSPRARAIFHAVVLSELDDNLAASDLFGHLSGSYTDARQNRPGHFVTANRGTLFLDEIGKASGAVQRKLLHAIEHREIRPVGADRAVRVDVRLVTASNIPLETLVAHGAFLDDLAARLVHFRVRLPPLRERREDIPALVRQFMTLRAATCGHPLRVPRVHADLMAILCRADWPYNLRQLDGVLQRVMMEAANAGSDELTPEHCPEDTRAMLRGKAPKRQMPTPEEVRDRMLELKSPGRTADSLGISRWTVGRYLQRAQESDAGDD